jgi:two-component system, sensor histidine kinase and response regulator
MTSKVLVGTVLVVDDNAENRALAKATLEDEGIDVVLAPNGEQGLAAFTRAPPDCILLDIKMPGITGIEVCERIRAMPGGDRVPIIFVTAQRDVETFDRALLAGGDDFITKPFRPPELVVRIQTAMRLRRMAAEQGELSVQLKRQRDELQRLQLHKESLSAFLVHDLKNPVNSIDLCAQRILRNAAIDERTRDAASRIQDETRGLLRMIMNLLDIGKADEGRLAPVRTRSDLGELVREAADELRLRAQSSAVGIELDVESGSVYADRELLHRVLVNLIDNALRHAPEDSAVRITARTIDGETELRVIDRGPGVPPELRDQVFDRFVTAGARGNRGLGLAFCKAVVTAHGGRIWVDDGAPGASFCMRIGHAG